MLVLLSDTHREDDPALAPAVAEAVSSASLVAHAGDFTTLAVLAAFEDAAAEFVGVAGNSDSRAVTERLPEWQTFRFGGRQFLVTHGHRHDRTSLSVLARGENADVVVVGHTHSGGIDHVGDVAVVNPGSHADPRGGVATFAAVRRSGDGLRVRVRTTEGDPRESTVV